MTPDSNAPKSAPEKHEAEAVADYRSEMQAQMMGID